MKKFIAWIMALTCLIGLAGCNQNEETQPTDTTSNTETINQEISKPESYEFEAQYVRTDGSAWERSSPYCIVIDSKEELEAYYAANKEQFDLERKETALGFLDACDKYNDAYFENNNLILIVLQEGSGSTRHEITDVRAHQDEYGTGWDITINRILAEMGTCDMAQWHLFLEMQSDVIQESDPIWINGELCEIIDN